MAGRPRRIVAVASGKGGVGKSTIALNLAVTLAKAHPGRVGLLDADLYAPDLPAMVGLTRRQPARALEVWQNPALADRRSAPVEAYGVKLMSTQFLLAEDQTVAMAASMAELLVGRLTTGLDWGPLDWLLVDLPPGTADVQQLVASQVRPDGVVVVVTPQDVAHLDAKKAIALYRSQGVPIVGAVENMAGLVCPCCGERVEVFPAVAPERSIWADNVVRLASIPLQPHLARAAEDGIPAVVADPDGPTADAFRALARSIDDQVPSVSPRA
jgi:ATP-binding protein involved in chromosome partitioning